MKRILLFLLCLLLLAGCTPRGAQYDPPEESVSPVPARPFPTLAPPEESAPGELIWTGQVFAEDFAAADGTIVLTAQFFLPAIDNPTDYAPWAAINNFYAEKGEQQLEDARTQALWAVDDYAVAEAGGFPFDPYVMSQTFTVSLETEQFVSIVRTGTLAGGGMPEEQWLFAEQFALDDGRPLDFADFFTGLSSDAQARVGRLLLETAAGSPEVPDTALLTRHFVPNRFYLTEQDFVVFFNPRDLSPDSAHSPSFPIPLDALRDLLISW